jgi:hypothetical protein
MAVREVKTEILDKSTGTRLSNAGANLSDKRSGGRI